MTHASLAAACARGYQRPAFLGCGYRETPVRPVGFVTADRNATCAE